MDFFTLLQQRDIRQLREERANLRRQHDRASWHTPKLKELAKENLDLKLRLGLLVRLLIAKKVITAEELAALIAEAGKPH
jgi:hypothetical protein